MMNRLKRLFLAVVLALAALPSFSAGISDYLENKLIDHLFRATAFTAPTTLCVGLITGTGTDAGTGAAPGTEASYTGYARTALNAGVAAWKSTNGATSGASSGTGGTTSNASIITIGSAATSGPQVLTGFFLADSCTIGAGNIHFYAPLTASKTINNGDPAPTFAVDALAVQIDN
jgi:hypothetical protein